MLLGPNKFLFQIFCSTLHSMFLFYLLYILFPRIISDSQIVLVMLSHTLRLSTLRRWKVYGRTLLSSRRYAIAKAKKVDSAVLDTWKREVVLKLNNDLKQEHRRYGAKKQLLNHEHKVVWYIYWEENYVILKI